MALLEHDPCAYCGAPHEQVDHIEPVARGGITEWANLTSACRPCNRSKRDIPLLLWMLRRAS